MQDIYKNKISAKCSVRNDYRQSIKKEGDFINFRLTSFDFIKYSPSICISFKIKRERKGENVKNKRTITDLQCKQYSPDSFQQIIISRQLVRE